MFTEIEKHAGLLGLIVAVLPVAWAAWHYLALKRKELRSERFKTYHLLIKQLVQPEEKDGNMRIDRQLAIVFEFRRFPEYFEPSLRILEGLRQDWKNGNYGRLFDEMDATIPLIKKRNGWVWYRFKQWLRILFIET
jgi:hypothetical protein